MLCRPSLGRVPIPNPVLHHLCPLSLPSASPWGFGRASQVSLLPFGPVTDDKRLLTLSLCKLLLPLFPVPAPPAAEPVQDMITCPSCEGGGWAGVMHVLPLALECLPASLTAAPEPGTPRDTLLLPAAGVAWCCRKYSTAAVAWITAPENLGSGASRPEGKPLLPATLLIARLDPPSGCRPWLVFHVAARFAERCSGECLCALWVSSTQVTQAEHSWHGQMCWSVLRLHLAGTCMTWWVHEELWQETRQFFAVVTFLCCFLLLPVLYQCCGVGWGSTRTAGAGVKPEA